MVKGIICRTGVIRLSLHTLTHSVSANTLRSSLPMYHMQISTHPEEPLHFLWTSRPTMLHLCGHDRARKKRSVVKDSAEIYSGLQRRNGNTWRPLFSGSTILSIHNLGVLETGLLQCRRSQNPQVCFFADIKRALGETLSVRSFCREKDCVFIKFKVSSQ